MRCYMYFLNDGVDTNLLSWQHQVSINFLYATFLYIAVIQGVSYDL